MRTLALQRDALLRKNLKMMYLYNYNSDMFVFIDETAVDGHKSLNSMDMV